MRGTPREHDLVCEIGDERFLIATPSNEGRHWNVQRISSQDAQPEPFTIHLADFSEGYGFSYEGLEGTYDRASGWDASVPGKPATWPRRATGAPFTSVDYRGWLVSHGGYVYALRGEYAVKYAIDDTVGTVWPIIERHYFGSAIVVSGRPAIFAGALYVPLRGSGGGAVVDWHELTTVATTTVETQTIVISGSPTGGSYTVTFDTRTSAAIAWNAGSTIVQAALRLIPGLEDITIVETGTTPNFTHTISMTGVGGADTTSSPPQMTSADSLTGGTPVITHATTVAGVSDTWTDGPNTREMTCLKIWEDKLVGAVGNLIYTCSGDPLTAGDWAPAAGAGYAVGDSSEDIVDLDTHDRYLIVGKTNGLWSFDENLNTTNELSELEDVIDSQNTIGMANWNGYTYIPHKAGLVKWRPGAYEIVGASMEGALEADISRGWGRVTSMARFGRYAFYTINDSQNTRGVIASLQPPRKGRSPVIPHMHHEVEDGSFEAIAVISALAQPVLPRTPATWTDDAAVGSITWGTETNAAASDDAYATAAAGTSHYLKGLNPGFQIPTGATITGILVEIERSVS